MRRRKIQEQERIMRRSSKIEAETDMAMTSSMAEKANTFSAGDNKACSDGGSRMNEHSNGKKTRTRDKVPPRKDPYAIEMDRGRNCYAYGGFGYLACHCRNQGERVAEERRIKYNGRREV